MEDFFVCAYSLFYEISIGTVNWIFLTEKLSRFHFTIANACSWVFYFGVAVATGYLDLSKGMLLIGYAVITTIVNEFYANFITI